MYGNLPTPLPIQADPWEEHVSHAESKVAFTTLAHSVEAQNEWITTFQANPVAKYCYN